MIVMLMLITFCWRLGVCTAWFLSFRGFSLAIS